MARPASALGEYIRRQRELRDLSIRQVAQMAGMENIETTVAKNDALSLPSFLGGNCSEVARDVQELVRGGSVEGSVWVGWVGVGRGGSRGSE